MEILISHLKKILELYIFYDIIIYYVVLIANDLSIFCSNLVAILKKKSFFNGKYVSLILLIRQIENIDL